MAIKGKLTAPTATHFIAGEAAFSDYETDTLVNTTTGTDFPSLGSLPDGDPEATPLAAEAQTYELGSGDSTEILDVRGVKSLMAVTDGTAKWEVPSEDGSFYDFHVMTAQSQTATTNVGVISADSMPPYVRLTDTSSAANTVTIYARF